MSAFTEHPASRFVLVPIMCALLLLTPVYDEMRPVLKSFNVTEVKWVPGGLEVWGVMEKQRKCATGPNCWWYRLTERRMPIWRRGS